jgi:alanine dehydrogenase
VAAAPSAVRALVGNNHSVLVEQSAGLASGFSDDEYIRAGAAIAPTAEECFDQADFVWKVVAPSAHERSLLRPPQKVAALFHASEPLPGGVQKFALERVGQGGDSPVLAAMSEIAGRLGVEYASQALSRVHGGLGLLLGGVPGVAAARVVVIGAGVAGRAAAELAAGVGADVEVLDVEPARLRSLRVPGVRTLHSTPHTVERALIGADVVVAAVRDAEGGAPRVASRAHLSLMQPGSVVVDLSILDGGAFESTPLTTPENPTRLVDGIVHVGVPNLAGSVPRTASVALSLAALPWILRELSKG